MVVGMAAGSAAGNAAAGRHGGRPVAVPRYALDMSTVEPSRKRKLPAASAGAEKKEKKPCKLEWCGAACCNGLHFYRNGPGHKGGAYWQCGVTTCRKILTNIC